MENLYLFITYFFTIMVFIVGIVIFLERRDPDKTIAWLLVLVVFPVFGFFIYLMFGSKIRKKRLSRKMREKSEAFNWNDLVLTQKERVKKDMLYICHGSSDVKMKFINLLLTNSNSPFSFNNRTEVLESGDKTFEEKIKAMESAKSHIHLEYFIVKNDGLGNRIKDLLIKKSKEGVKIRFIYDGLGGRHLNNKYLNDLKNAGVDVRPFFPIKFPQLNSHFSYRNHRKILIIDGKIGFIGGLNIGDEYINKSSKYLFWRDTHIKIEGEAVYILQNIFLKNWHFISGEYPEEKEYFPKIGKMGEELLHIVPSGPDYEWESIHQAYFSMINSAMERIYVTTPYLIPDDSINTALKVAALSGVDVRIIVPGIPDKKFVYYATRSYFEELIKAGVKIYKYNKGFVHAKTITVDSKIASIGTANFDSLSFRYSFEVNAFCFDELTAVRLEEDFIEDLKDSEEVTKESTKNITLTEKVMESAARLASPIL